MTPTPKYPIVQAAFDTFADRLRLPAPMPVGPGTGGAAVKYGRLRILRRAVLKCRRAVVYMRFATELWETAVRDRLAERMIKPYDFALDFAFDPADSTLRHVAVYRPRGQAHWRVIDTAAAAAAGAAGAGETAEEPGPPESSRDLSPDTLVGDTLRRCVARFAAGGLPAGIVLRVATTGPDGASPAISRRDTAARLKPPRRVLEAAREAAVAYGLRCGSLGRRFSGVFEYRPPAEDNDGEGELVFGE